jgi:hypothetical protein
MIEPNARHWFDPENDSSVSPALTVNSNLTNQTLSAGIAYTLTSVRFGVSLSGTKRLILSSLT